MNYARNKLLNKKLPAFLGFFVLLFALGITLLLSSNTVLFITKATVGSEPKNIQVSNVSGTSFTVTFITDTPTSGGISYGTDPSTPNEVLDDRDQQASGSAEHQIHFITIKNLAPATKYFYVINSGSQKTENNGAPYEITTASQTGNSNTNQPAVSGTVALSDGGIPTEGLVFVTMNNTQLAALLNPDGTYQVPLNQIPASTTPLTPDTVLNIQVVTPTQQSSAKVLLSNAGQVPKIIVPQNYDFTLGTNQTDLKPSSVASVSGFPELATPAPVSSPEITTPTDAQAFKDQQPLFEGRALPDTDVEITIQSQQEISTKVHSNKSGLWEFRPPTNLAPGKHTITIKSLDTSGIMQTITRSFTVYAQGSKFVEPSVSPVATPKPTAAPTAVVTPTLAPTEIPTPTAAPTSAPTIPATHPTAVPSKAPIPPTGSTAAIVGTITGVAILGIGALLFILSIV